MINETIKISLHPQNVSRFARKALVKFSQKSIISRSGVPSKNYPITNNSNRVYYILLFFTAFAYLTNILFGTCYFQNSVLLLCVSRFDLFVLWNQFVRCCQYIISCNGMDTCYWIGIKEGLYISRSRDLEIFLNAVPVWQVSDIAKGNCFKFEFHAIFQTVVI